MNTKNPLLIELIKQIQAGSAQEVVLENIKNLFINKGIDEDECNFSEIAALLINYKQKKAFYYLIENEKEQIKTISSNLYKLLEFSIEKGEQECAEKLVDFIIENKIQVNPKSPCRFAEAAIDKNYFLILEKLLDYNNTIINGTLKYNNHLIKDTKIYDLLLKHGFTIDLDRFSQYPEMLKEYSDEIICKIITDEHKSLKGLLKSDDEIMKIISFLIKEDKVKSLATFINQFPFVQNDLILKLINESKLCLIRSNEMYDLLSLIDKRISINYLQSDYFLKLCHYSIQSSCDINDHWGHSWSSENLEYSKNIFFEETEGPLKLLENKLTPESINASLYENLHHFKYLALSAAKHGLPKMINFFFTKPTINSLPDDIIEASLIGCFRHQDKNLIEIFVKSLSLDNMILQNFIIDNSQSFYNPYIPMIIKYHGKDILNNEKIVNKIRNTNSPKIAQAFIEIGMKFDAKQLNKLLNIANIQNDIEIIQFYRNRGDIETANNKSVELIAGVKSNDCEMMKRYYGDGITQQSYKEIFHEIVSIITDALQNKAFKLLEDKDNKLKSNYSSRWFDQDTPSGKKKSRKNEVQTLTLPKLGNLRKFIAKISGTENYEVFGKSRENNMITPQTGRYSSYFNEFLNNVVPENYDPDKLQYHGYVIEDGELGVNAMIKANINDEEVILTSSLMIGMPMWRHTSENIINMILSYVDNLIKEATHTPIDLSDEKAVASLTFKLAKIHWWLAQATPFERGSAAVVEMLVSALFRFHHLSVEWSCLPDCKALIEPDVEKFASQYESFSKIAFINYPSSSVHATEISGLRIK